MAVAINRERIAAFLQEHAVKTEDLAGVCERQKTVSSTCEMKRALDK